MHGIENNNVTTIQLYSNRKFRNTRLPGTCSGSTRRSLMKLERMYQEHAFV